METQMDLYTGGLHASNHLSECPNDLGDLSRRGLLVSSHALERNSAKMFELWSDIFHHVFESKDELRERLSTLVKMAATDSMNGLAYSGHHYAMMHAASKLTGLKAPRLRERDSGLTSVRFVNKLALSIQNGDSQVIDEILHEMTVLARS